MPCVSLGDVEIRRFRGRLHLVPREPPFSVPAPRRWRIPEPLAFDHGELGCERCTGFGLDDGMKDLEIVVRFRGDDATWMRPIGVRGHALKKRFQSLDIPPWERGRIPLVYAGGILAAVGSAWIDPRFGGRAGNAGVGGWYGRLARDHLVTVPNDVDPNPTARCPATRRLRCGHVPA